VGAQVFEGNSPPGYISLEALERALLLYGADRLTKEQVKELVSQLETENGLFNYADYVALMMTN
jgi:Ca2+-binding EF-hand superfamily protein